MANEKQKISDFMSKDIGKTRTEGLHLYGHFSIDHARNGEVIDHREIDNVIVNGGKTLVAGLMLADVGGTAFDYIAIGRGVVAADAAEVALGDEITTLGGQRKTGVGTLVTTLGGTANDTAQLVTTFTFTGAFAVTESGMFNAASSVTMLCRQVFAAVNVASGDTLTITWRIQLT